MKYSRSAVHRRLHKIPALRFETQTLTSFGGLVLFQALNARLRLKERLRACFSHLPAHPIFGHHVVVLLSSSISSWAIANSATSATIATTRSSNACSACTACPMSRR